MNSPTPPHDEPPASRKPPERPELPEPSERPDPAALRPLVYRSAELLQGRREIWIEHGDETYRLRVTSAGRLYLTK